MTNSNTRNKSDPLNHISKHPIKHSHAPQHASLTRDCGLQRCLQQSSHPFIAHPAVQYQILVLLVSTRTPCPSLRPTTSPAWAHSDASLIFCTRHSSSALTHNLRSRPNQPSSFDKRECRAVHAMRRGCDTNNFTGLVLLEFL